MKLQESAAKSGKKAQKGTLVYWREQVARELPPGTNKQGMVLWLGAQGCADPDNVAKVIWPRWYREQTAANQARDAQLRAQLPGMLAAESSVGDVIVAAKSLGFDLSERVAKRIWRGLRENESLKPNGHKPSPDFSQKGQGLL